MTGAVVKQADMPKADTTRKATEHDQVEEEVIWSALDLSDFALNQEWLKNVTQSASDSLVFEKPQQIIKRSLLYVFLVDRPYISQSFKETIHG